MPQPIFTEPARDRPVDHRRFNELLGLKSKTAHTARQYAKRGWIRAYRLNARVIRYSEQSILEFLHNSGLGNHTQAAQSTGKVSS